MHLCGGSEWRAGSLWFARYKPSEFSIILGVFPSKTATAEFVVPVNDLSVTVINHKIYQAGLTKIDTDDLPLDFLFTSI